MPTPTFARLGVPEDLLGVLSRRGIEQPFPIQSATLPDALAGRDICGRAPTGSGKTLAFGLALVQNATRAKPRRPGALVLTPTRELAAQIHRELEPLAHVRGHRMATVYGGVGYQPQRQALRRGVEILVACPGRLEDLLAQGDLVLEDVSMVVVDEADRMADMGFLPAVRRLLDATRSDRQTMLFSATLDGEVDVLVRHYQRDPRRYEVAAPEDQQGDVRHVFWHAARAERVGLVSELVARHGPSIVFCRTRHGADRVSRQLARSGVTAAAIHGSRSQPQRDRALHAFKSGRVQALVATDVAARGIHVDDVPCIVHFDPPGSAKDYVHRSGRTGRAGARGVVVSLVERENVGAIRAIQRALNMPQGVDTPDVRVRPEPTSRPQGQPASRPSGRKPAQVAREGKGHGNGGRKRRDRRRERIA